MCFMVESILPILLKSDNLREYLVNSSSACSVLETSTSPWLTTEKASLARENVCGQKLAGSVLWELYSYAQLTELPFALVSSWIKYGTESAAPKTLLGKWSTTVEVSHSPGKNFYFSTIGFIFPYTR